MDLPKMGSKAIHCMKRAIRQFLSATAVTAAIGAALVAQQSKAPDGTGGPAPGVSANRIMERPQVRVGRLTMQPGSTRPVHQHDEFPFQLFVPLTGKTELTLGTKKIDCVIGEVYFIDHNEPHGFRNTGTEPSTSLEIFIKDPHAKAAIQQQGPAALGRIISTF
jgi:quercetin dioxygenase-like cupin family protein